jgi:hypothetical protein
MTYKCDLCKKTYISRQSLCNHNKKFHSSSSIIKNDINKNFICNYCDKHFITKQTLNNHIINNCYIKKYNENNNNTQNNINNENENDTKKIRLQIESDKIKLQIIEREIDKIKLEKETLELKIKFNNMLQNKLKMHPKTFKSLNNKLINNSINNSHNTINNITNNNFQIIALGKENLLEILTLNEKRDIMKSKFNCLEKIVDIVHCSNYNQFTPLKI